MGDSQYSTLELLYNLAEAIPAFYKVIVTFAALIGTAVFLRGLAGLARSNRQNQRPDRTTLAGLIFGPMFFSLGPLLAAGTNQAWATSSHKEILDSFEPLTGVSHTTALAFVVITYITFVGWVLMLATLYTAHGGLRHQVKGWGGKAVSMYALAVFATNFAWTVDAVSTQAGYGSVSKEYFNLT